MTNIADIVEPEPMADYMMDDLTVKNALWDSGIVASNPLLANFLEGGGRKFTVPYWGDITGTESEVPVENTAGTVGNIGTYELNVVRQLRRADWGASSLTSIMAGDNALSAIQKRVSTYWKTQMQDILVASITGVLDSTDGAQILFDAAAADGTDPDASNLIAATHIIDTQALLGDNVDLFKAMIVHPSVFADMRKNNLIDFVQETESTKQIAFYGDMRVIVDSNVPIEVRTSATLGNQNVYTSILLKEAAFGFGETQTGFKPVHIEDDQALGMGEETLYTKRNFILHPAGWDFDNSAGVAGLAPTNTELAVGARWALKQDVKLSGFVALKTN